MRGSEELLLDHIMSGSEELRFKRIAEFAEVNFEEIGWEGRVVS